MENVFLPFALREMGSPRSTSSLDPQLSTKLFVGCLPYDATEEDLYPLFNKFGQIIELAIQRDRSGFSKGCAWLKYATREACEACIAQLHNQYYLGNVRSAMQVKFASNTSNSTPSPAPSTFPDVLVPPEHAEQACVLSGLPLTVPDSEIFNALVAFGEITMFRQFANRRSDALVVFATAEARETLLTALRLRGTLIIAGFPCYTLRVSSTHGEQLYPTFPGISGYSPVSGSHASLSAFSPTSAGAGTFHLQSSGLTNESSLGPLSPTAYSEPVDNFAPGHPHSYVLPPAPPLAEPLAARISGAVPHLGAPQLDLGLGSGSAPAKLFVGCLPYSKTAGDLNTLFSQYGTILEVALLTNPDGRSKGAAFITFASLEMAQVAKQGLDGFVFPGSTRAINVSFATNQTWRPPVHHPMVQQQMSLADSLGFGDSGEASTTAPVTLELDRHLDWSSSSASALSPTSANLHRLLNQIMNFSEADHQQPQQSSGGGFFLSRPPGFDLSPKNANINQGGSNNNYDAN
jgi:RNA recognition motif-containing protein